jgi:hypothetical protein
MLICKKNCKVKFIKEYKKNEGLSKNVKKVLFGYWRWFWCSLKDEIY